MLCSCLGGRSLAHSPDRGRDVGRLLSQGPRRALPHVVHLRRLFQEADQGARAVAPAPPAIQEQEKDPHHPQSLEAPRECEPLKISFTKYIATATKGRRSPPKERSLPPKGRNSLLLVLWLPYSTLKHVLQQSAGSGRAKSTMLTPVSSQIVQAPWDISLFVRVVLLSGSQTAL